jgi:hypothetical protein
MTDQMNDMERIKGLIESLADQMEERNWERCSELYFRIVYGLPAELQIELARLASSGYLPIFESKWSNVKWPRQLLSDVGQWVAQHARQLPNEPEDTDPADASFLSSLDPILLAAMYSDDRFTVTSSCSAAVNFAIGAFQTNVWMVDDPEALRMWQEQEYLIGRSVVDNVAAMAVGQREWSKVAARLNEREVWKEPSEIDEQEIEKALARWMDIEMLYTVPRE